MSVYWQRFFYRENIYKKNTMENFKIFPQLEKEFGSNSTRLPCTAGILFWTKTMTPFWKLRTAVEKPNILRCMDTGHSDHTELPEEKKKNADSFWLHE
jgi:hypothetical protein